MSRSEKAADAVAKTASSPRRKPAQQRSRARLDQILAAATALIGQGGSEHLKMSEVASRAGISIGSLYQYFPDKAALIRQLAERYHAENRRCVVEALASVETLEALRERFNSLVDTCYALVRQEPVFRDIWSGMQADKALMNLELAESRVCGEILAQAVRRVRPDADPESLAARCFLIWQLGEATFRLAVTVAPDEGAVYVETYKRMSWSEMTA